MEDSSNQRTRLLANYHHRTTREDLVSLYDDLASSYDASMPLSTERRVARVDQFIRQYMGRVDLAIELGVGTGRLLSQIDAERRIGLDLSGEMCLYARRRGIETVVGDMRHLPFSDGTADGIVSGYGAVNYLPLDIVAGEVSRVLRKGGRFGLHLVPKKTVRIRGLFPPWREEALYSFCPPYTLPETPRWVQLRQMFEAGGLYIEQRLLLRNVAFPKSFVELPALSSMLFANHIGLAGYKVGR